MAHKTVFISGLPNGTTEQKLRDFFANFGEVGDVNIRKDKNKNTIAFATLDEELAERAISRLNGKEIDGRKIYVEFAKNQERAEKTKVRFEVKAERAKKGASMVVKVSDVRTKKPLAKRKVAFWHDDERLFHGGSDYWETDDRGEISFTLAHASPEDQFRVEDVETGFSQEKKLGIAPEKSQEEMDAIREKHIADAEHERTRAWEARERREKKKEEVVIKDITAIPIGRPNEYDVNVHVRAEKGSPGKRKIELKEVYGLAENRVVETNEHGIVMFDANFQGFESRYLITDLESGIFKELTLLGLPNEKGD